MTKEQLAAHNARHQARAAQATAERLQAEADVLEQRLQANQQARATRRDQLIAQGMVATGLRVHRMTIERLQSKLISLDRELSVLQRTRTHLEADLAELRHAQPLT